MSEEFKFNPDQVANLNAYQVAGRFHPFTCPNRNLKTHRIFNGDLGALVATVRGWICPWCDYTQEWAHDFMCEPLPPDYVGEMLADHRDTTAIKQEREADLLKFMYDEHLDLRTVVLPTGAGDADVIWRAISFHMSEPKERIIGEGTTPAEALAVAIRRMGE